MDRYIPVPHCCFLWNLNLLLLHGCLFKNGRRWFKLIHSSIDKDFEISPFVKSMSSRIQIPVDYNYKNDRVNLSKHFGKLKRNIDGLEYQIKARKD
jgi:hypothetical protein